MAGEENTVFWREGNQNLLDASDNDTWDDTELIKAYDKAVAQLKGEVVHSTSSNCQTKEGDKTKRKKKKKRRSQEWKVGDICIAIYEEDGLYYDATILFINHDEQRVNVKFSHYGNEAELSFDQLLPIACKSKMEVVSNYVNETEPHLSEEEKSDVDENEEDEGVKIVGGLRVSDICYIQSKKRGSYQKAVINSFVSSDICQVTIIKSNQKREVKISHIVSSLPSDHQSPGKSKPSHDLPWPPPDFPDHIPPPPPPFFNPAIQSFPSFPNTSSWENFTNIGKTPFMSSNFPQCPPLPCLSKDLMMGNEEALANMLMSWYMSGYHTGYYQGMQQNARNSSQMYSQQGNQNNNAKKNNRGKRRKKIQVSN